MFLLLCFFFFKQKTAYEMRISDWSSDVCSSDLSSSATERWEVMLSAYSSTSFGLTRPRFAMSRKELTPAEMPISASAAISSIQLAFRVGVGTNTIAGVPVGENLLAQR